MKGKGNINDAYGLTTYDNVGGSGLNIINIKEFADAMEQNPILQYYIASSETTTTNIDGIYYVLFNLDKEMITTNVNGDVSLKLLDDKKNDVSNNPLIVSNIETEGQEGQILLKNFNERFDSIQTKKFKEAEFTEIDIDEEFTYSGSVNKFGKPNGEGYIMNKDRSITLSTKSENGKLVDIKRLKNSNLTGDNLTLLGDRKYLATNGSLIAVQMTTEFMVEKLLNNPTTISSNDLKEYSQITKKRQKTRDDIAKQFNESQERTNKEYGWELLKTAGTILSISTSIYTGASIGMALFCRSRSRSRSRDNRSDSSST